MKKTKIPRKDNTAMDTTNSTIASWTLQIVQLLLKPSLQYRKDQICITE